VGAGFVEAGGGERVGGGVSPRVAHSRVVEAPPHPDLLPVKGEKECRRLAVWLMSFIHRASCLPHPPSRSTASSSATRPRPPSPASRFRLRPAASRRCSAATAPARPRRSR